MIFNIFKDVEWKKILSIADPSLDPDSNESIWIRLKIGHIVCGAYFLYRDKKDGGPRKSFNDFARAGETFIQGMRNFDLFIDSARFTTLHFDPAARVDFEKRSFNEELADKVQHYCDLFRKMESYLESWEEPSIKEGPNKKEWLHTAIHQLHDVWQDEFGQGSRPKKDFLAFAYAVLEPLKIGVTENSVLESFDRHVKRRKDIRRQLMRARQLRLD